MLSKVRKNNIWYYLIRKCIVTMWTAVITPYPDLLLFFSLLTWSDRSYLQLNYPCPKINVDNGNSVSLMMKICSFRSTVFFIEAIWFDHSFMLSICSLIQLKKMQVMFKVVFARISNCAVFEKLLDLIFIKLFFTYFLRDCNSRPSAMELLRDPFLIKRW